MKEIINKRSIIYMICAALLLMIVLNLSGFTDALAWLYNAFSALIIGGCIAFVLNLFVDFFSDKVFASMLNPKHKLILSLVCSVLVFLLLLLLLVFLVIPQLIEAFRVVAMKLPKALDDAQHFVVSITERFPAISKRFSEIKASKTDFSGNFTHYLKTELPQVLGRSFVLAKQTVSSVTTAVVAILISLYIIMSKKELGHQAREFCYGLMSRDSANKTLYIAHLTANDFKAFIYGRVLDALIMAVAYLVIALIFRLPYTLMISSIIAIFSIIPLFGALISWALGFFLIVTVSFWQAVIFTVVILVIFFVTRNFIYPRLIANSVGLPDLWVLVAVVVGGKLFGLMGMLTAVPIFSVIYRLLALTVHQHLDKKKISSSRLLYLPDWTDYDALKNDFKEGEYAQSNEQQKN